MNIHWTKIRKWTLLMWDLRTRKQLFCICPAFIMLTVSLTLFIISSVLSLNIPLESVAKVQHDPEARASSNATTCPACLLAKSSSTIQSKFPWLFNNANTRFHTFSWMKENHTLNIRITQITLYKGVFSCSFVFSSLSYEMGKKMLLYFVIMVYFRTKMSNCK